MLEELSSDLGQLAREDRLDWLISQGAHLPELTEGLGRLRDAGEHGVAECMAPVFFYAARESGRFIVYGDVPREAPTARGFVGFLISTFHGRPLSELPTDILDVLHLRDCLSLQRQRGLDAIYKKLKLHGKS